MDSVGVRVLREDLKQDVLLLGCGNMHDKRVVFSPEPEYQDYLGTGSPWDNFDQYARLHLHDRDPAVIEEFDIPAHNTCDLNELPYPWSDEQFDEIHAYEVLEHCGRQGDGDFFFGQFNEFWRILKPGGYFCLSVPMWDAEVAWGVPDHKRVLPQGIFGFLTKDYYDNIGKPGYGDYRHMLKGRYWIAVAKHETEEQLNVVLRKLPSEDG
jgi:SAM-dependent methyltransferase